MLKDKIILITDTLHFLGETGCRVLTGAGAIVYAQDAEFTDAEARAKIEAEIPGVRALEEQDPTTIVDKIIAETGRLDVLVNNDAYPAIKAAIDEAEVAEFRRTLEALMVRGFHFASEASRHMKKAGRGKILFISSAAPKNGIPNYSMYVAARGGTNALARSLAKELGRFNIQVNALAPNFIESPMYFPDELLANKEAFKKITSQIPLGRLGTQEEAGEYLLFLVSDKSNFITGQELYLAGGWAT